MSATPECVLDAHALLGECPRWDPAEQCLYWVDIDGHKLHRFDPASGEDQCWEIGEEIGCLARCEGGVVAGLRSGLAHISLPEGTIHRLPSPDYDRNTVRFNDGRCDPLGRFWAGTLYQPKDHKAAWLYRLDLDGNLSRQAGPVYTANGLAFSPDGSRLYWADTPEHAIYVYELDLASGELGQQRLFHQFPYGLGRPDGAAVDSEGYYWSALYAGGRVVRLSPEGEIVAEIPLPARYPTMVAFGGADLRTLYITTARKPAEAAELRHFPQSGGLFATRVPVAGLPEPWFRGLL